MKVTCYGAAGGEVTGSAYLVQTERARVLVDCGLFQGGNHADAKNHAPLAFDPKTLDAVVLTHAHLDHSGRLPLLVRAGFAGPVHATPATGELTGLILRDSAKLQAQDAERQNRKRERAGEPLVQPLYSLGDVESLLRLLTPVPYREPVDVAPDIRAVFAEAGHMLGSSSIQLLVQANGRERKLVFSGDLGPRGAPILRDFEPFSEADVVFLESTYGDRDHRAFAETVEEFLQIIKQAVVERGKILVPTFAVGRAQLLSLLLAWAFREGVVKPFPVFLDSPMAIEASKIYQHHRELFDDDMVKFLREGSIEHDLATMSPSVTAEDSKKINEVPGPCLVLAGAGMCTGGRILHHLKQNLWKPETHVVIVGYQAQGSLGRMLVDGVSHVKMFGERIIVRARVHTLGGFSAHAGQTDLLHWVGRIASGQPRVVLTHGEDKPRRALAQKIREQHGLDSLLPVLGETMEF